MIRLAPSAAFWSTLRRPRHGQTLIFFALSMIVLMGALGLALDGGYNYTQRRAMQNAADAAALAGTKALSGNNSNGFTVWDTVKKVAEQNGVTDLSQLTCHYTDNSSSPQEVNTCEWFNDQPFTNGYNVSGVRVRAAERHQTFVMRVLGITTSGSAAVATAQIQAIVSLPNAQAPFLPCGINTKRVDSSGGLVDELSILKTSAPGYPSPVFAYSSGTPTTFLESVQGSDGIVEIDPAAFSYNLRDSASGRPETNAPRGGYNPYRFLIHKSSGNVAVGVARCTVGDSSFKGYNGATSGNITISKSLTLSGSTSYTTANGWVAAGIGPQTNDLGYTSGKGDVVYSGTGQRSGPAATVPGANGCTADRANNCYLMLPLVDNSVRGQSGTNNAFGARKFVTFYMQDDCNGRPGNCQPQEHYGYLVDGWTLILPGEAIWTPGYTGQTSIRLIQ
jgi:Flp pilus assembly protein TadG